MLLSLEHLKHLRTWNTADALLPPSRNSDLIIWGMAWGPSGICKSSTCDSNIWPRLRTIARGEVNIMAKLIRFLRFILQRCGPGTWHLKQSPWRRASKNLSKKDPFHNFLFLILPCPLQGNSHLRSVNLMILYRNYSMHRRVCTVPNRRFIVFIRFLKESMTTNIKNHWLIKKQKIRWDHLFGIANIRI